MIAIRVQSRIGNVVLGFIGLCYAVAAPALLVWYVRETWEAIGPRDLAVQTVLFACAVAGVLFLRVAARNLLRRRSQQVPHFFRSRPDASAV